MRDGFIYMIYESLTSFVVIFFELGGPESQVVSDQLHDRGRILVLILFDLVDISNSVVEGLLSQLAGFAWVVLNLIVEH